MTLIQGGRILDQPCNVSMSAYCSNCREIVVAHFVQKNTSNQSHSRRRSAMKAVAMERKGWVLLQWSMHGRPCVAVTNSRSWLWARRYFKNTRYLGMGHDGRVGTSKYKFQTPMGCMDGYGVHFNCKWKPPTKLEFQYAGQLWWRHDIMDKLSGFKGARFASVCLHKQSEYVAQMQNTSWELAIPKNRGGTPIVLSVVVFSTQKTMLR